MKRYTTYEEPLKGRTFTEKQMKEVYRDLADKKEYPDFACWLADMVKSGVIQRIGRSSVQVPNTNFKGGSIKWYEDKPKKADK